MNKILFPFTFAFTLTFFLSSCGPRGIDRFNWIEGGWKAHYSDLAYSEYWKKSSDELMSGESYVIQQGDTVYRDKLKIELIGETPCYVLTLPETKEPVIYKMTKSAEHLAVFENNEHDFPKLVYYELVGDSLHVKFEGVQDGHNAREETYYHKK